MVTQSAAWRFRKMEEGQKHVEPTHREHLASGGLVEPLVRETIQNSLDATLDGQVTKVMFTLGQVDAGTALPFFDTLRPHLEAVTRSLPEGLPDAGDPVRFLAIEDHNTRGLEGDPARHIAVNPDGSKNHFFRFWHMVGQSSGDFKRRGSWGVGKVVFSNTSRIRTFFGVTLRAGENSGLLMGEAGLIIHTVPGRDDVYDWYGYFANHIEKNAHYVALPIQDPETVSAFSRVFGLTRAEPGLSVLVPYVRAEVNPELIARSVMEQYFLPIIAGRLEVTVRDGGTPITITSATIDSAVDRVEWPSRGVSTREEMRKLLDLGRCHLALRANDYVRTADVDPPHYALEASHFPQGALERVSNDFALGKRIAIRVPVQVRARGASTTQEEVCLVLERDEALRTSNVPHLRSGINVLKMREQCGRGVRGLVVVGSDLDTQGDLDKLLQASEGPAHINWELRGEGYDKAKSLFDDAHRVISFMRHLVRRAVELLATPPDKQDTRTLSTFFPDDDLEGIASDAGSQNRRGSETGQSDRTPAAPPAGVIQGVVRSLVPSRGLLPVEGAVVQLSQSEAVLSSMPTDANGKFRFERVEPGEYTLAGSKQGVGEARRHVVVPSGHGVVADLVLKKVPAPRMFVRIPLNDGFAIRGNPDYTGALRPMRVRMAYAAWGGSRSFNEADFSLKDIAMQISFSGVAESNRNDLVAAPNVLRFTPVTNEFYVEVRGFDANRALHVDARGLDDEQVEQEDHT